MGRLSPYFFNHLPGFFKLQDSYKDAQDRGFLERFLEVFQEETESYIVTSESLANVIFPDHTPETHLSLLAGLYGNPPDSFQDLSYYRKILKLIPFINRHKGTILGVQRFFRVMDMLIDFIEHPKPTHYYDHITFYDIGANYDSDQNVCVEYSIEIHDFGGLVDPTSSVHLQNLDDILNYLLPVYMRKISQTIHHRVFDKTFNQTFN